MDSHSWKNAHKDVQAKLLDWSNMLLIYFWFFHLLHTACSFVRRWYESLLSSLAHRKHYSLNPCTWTPFGVLPKLLISLVHFNIASGSNFQTVLWYSRTKYLTNLPSSLLLNQTEPIIPFGYPAGRLSSEKPTTSNWIYGCMTVWIQRIPLALFLINI